MLAKLASRLQGFTHSVRQVKKRVNERGNREDTPREATVAAEGSSGERKATEGKAAGKAN